MNIRNVNSSSGLFEEFYLPSRSIQEQKVINRKEPHFLKVESEPLSFSLTLLLGKDINEREFRDIKLWLYQDNYKPLIFSSEPNKIYYSLIEGDSNIKHNGLGEGYFEINIRCNSPYAYTPEYIRENIEFLEDIDKQSIKLDKGNFNQFDLYKTELTSNGIKIKSVETWGDILDMDTKWGDLFEIV